MWRKNFGRRSNENLWFYWMYGKKMMVIEDGRIVSLPSEKITEHSTRPYAIYEDLADPEFIERVRVATGSKLLYWYSFYSRVAKFCEGMTIPEAEKYVIDHVNDFTQGKTQVLAMEEGFLCGAKIEIRRACGNFNKKTFDFVRTEIYLKTMTPKERDEKIKTNLKAIVKYALNQIEKNKYFARYGVPKEFLKPYSMAVSGNVLIIDFCLKG